MQLVDIVLLVLLVCALAVGAGRGLLANLGTLLGLVAGGAAALWLVPIVNDLVPLQGARPVVVVALIVVLLIAGRAVGSAIGSGLRRGVDRTRLRGIERVLGGVAGVVVAALAIALAGGAVVATGTPVISAALGSSHVLRTIDALTPDPVDEVLAQLRGAVTDDALPRLGELLGPGGTTAVPVIELDDPVLARAAASVARVSGTAYACGTSATGSGFVIADDRVVTNAHVVAGVERPLVELPGRGAAEGTIVYFDPVDDLAVIAVDDADAPALLLAPVLAAGTTGVVQGYPLGGPFTMGAAEIVSMGTVPVPDIYDESIAPREVYALAALVRPGNSGGPLLTLDGQVAGVVFARGEEGADRGYAMTTTELAPVVAASPGLSAPVASGACTT